MRIVLFIVLSLVFSSPSHAQDAKELRIGIDGTNPPFSHANIDGELSGLDIDLANRLCKTMKVKCSIVKLEWGNLIPAIRGNKIDLAIAAIRITEARQKMVDFSDPYLTLPSVLITHKNSTLSGIAEDDLRLTKIGALKSSIHAEYLRAHFPDAELILYESSQQYFLDLTNERLDAVIGNTIQLNDWLALTEGKNCCRPLGQLPIDVKINGEGFAIAIAKNQEKLLINTNKTLASLKKSKKLPKLVNAHLPFLK